MFGQELLVLRDEVSTVRLFFETGQSGWFDRGSFHF